MINSPTIAAHGQEDAPGRMLVRARMAAWVRACDFKVITPLWLPQAAQG